MGKLQIAYLRKWFNMFCYKVQNKQLIYIIILLLSSLNTRTFSQTQPILDKIKKLGMLN